MLKKTVSIVIVSVLAISIGAVSVFAGNISNQTTVNSVAFGCQIFSSEPVLIHNGSTELGDTFIYAGSNTYPSSTIVSGIKNWWTYKTSYHVTVFITNQSGSIGKQLPFLTLTIPLGQDALPSNISTFGESLSNFSYNSDDNTILSYVDYVSSSNTITIQVRAANQSTVKLMPQRRITISIDFDLFETFYSTAASPDISKLDASHAASSISFSYNNSITDITDLNTIQYDNTTNLQRINENVKSILDAYTSNSAAAGELKSDVQTNDQKLDNIHQNEAEWYSQNSQAIESTGLSNFEFSTDQSSALTGVFSLFQRLWTALGDYTFVVTFTLMMSFATFFLRHNPVKKTSGNNYSRNYSKGGGESRGSSAG